MESDIQPVEIVLNKDDCPSMFANPFQSDKVQDIDICISKRFTSIQKGHPVKATVRMENNNTLGLQYFYGDSLMDVVKQVDSFLKQIDKTND